MYLCEKWGISATDLTVKVPHNHIHIQIWWKEDQDDLKLNEVMGNINNLIRDFGRKISVSLEMGKEEK